MTRDPNEPQNPDATHEDEPIPSASEDKVLDVMCEQIYDKFFPDKVNPFNPKKSKNLTK